MTISDLSLASVNSWSIFEVGLRFGHLGRANFLSMTGDSE
jgi:hypothetical protein